MAAIRYKSETILSQLAPTISWCYLNRIWSRLETCWYALWRDHDWFRKAAIISLCLPLGLTHPHNGQDFSGTRVPTAQHIKNALLDSHIVESPSFESMPEIFIKKAWTILGDIDVVQSLFVDMVIITDEFTDYLWNYGTQPSSWRQATSLTRKCMLVFAHRGVLIISRSLLIYFLPWQFYQPVAYTQDQSTF